MVHQVFSGQVTGVFRTYLDSRHQIQVVGQSNTMWRHDWLTNDADLMTCCGFMLLGTSKHFSSLHLYRRLQSGLYLQLCSIINSEIHMK
jgi:hypothetical protein